MIVSLKNLPRLAPPECGAVHLLQEEPDFRRIAADWASLSGHRPTAHESVASFLEAAQGPRPACLVLDMTFGGDNGLEIQSRITRERNCVPVVFITDRADARSAIAAMKQGAFTVLEKPCDKEQFCEAIGEAIARDAAVTRLLGRHESLCRRFENLTPRERLVMNLVVEGKLNKAIARELQMTERTVERVRAVVLEKVGADSAVQMASLLTEHRLLGELLCEPSRTDRQSAGDYVSGQ